MANTRDEDWEDSGEVQAKRRRPTEQCTVDQGKDCYHELLGGAGREAIHNSWLTAMHIVNATTLNSRRNNRADGVSYVKSLSRQLIQVKRRLWPAAERCAKACGSSPGFEFQEARRLANPMELLGEGNNNGLNRMFMNRSAVKLANIDAMLEFRLTAGSEEHFTFVDLCGAPGGFSEYLVKRLEQERMTGSCRGYGMSLIGANEHGNGALWKLEPVSYMSGGFQTNYQVCMGADGTGDVYRWENVVTLHDTIRKDTQSVGLPQPKVHLVVADGGFDAQRDSECQEELAQKLVLCEMAAGLSLLQFGGTMVLKMFGFQTSTMRTAMQSLYDLFEEFVILKPISSRPASAERYVIFRGFRGVAPDWDGPSWMSNVFLGRAIRQLPSHYVGLNQYLDEIDGDILSLNLKACFTLLSSLERKTAAGYETIHTGNQQDPPVHVNLYKHAWRLV